MGSKTDGFVAANMKSMCCSANVRILNKDFVTEAWCEKCGNYIYIKPVKILVALYSGDLDGVKYMNGYLPAWLKDLIAENETLKVKIKELEENGKKEEKTSKK